MMMSWLLAPALMAGAFSQSSSEENRLLVSAWLVFWNPTSLERFEAQAAHIDEIKPEWIGVDEQGMPFRREHGTPEMKARFWRIAKQHDVKTLAMVSNFASEVGGFEATRVQRMLATSESRARHIEALVDIVVEDGFDGLDLDIESLEGRDRDAFSVYVEELGRVLRARNLHFSVTVHPKETDEGNWGGPQAQDYARIGKAADALRIMTYDFSWSGSEAGPIAPNDWVERVMTYAATKVPREKLHLGIAGYGYDWTVEPTRSMTWADWQPHDAAATYCPRSNERVLGARHYSGAAAFRAKREIAQRLRLGGIALWYVGSEDPAVWKR